jgi:hypothetical protein
MPLEKGKSHEVGKPKEQAAAIAYKTARGESAIDDAFKAMCDSVTSMRDACRVDAKFSDKPAARIELNRSSRVIEKYWVKHQSGEKISSSERAEWQEAFKRKSAAQQYLTSTQPVPEIDAMLDSVEKMKTACDDRRVIGGVGNKMTAAEIKADNSRNDGFSTTKNFRFVTRTELDLGKAGFGDINFAVAVKVSVDASLDRIITKEWFSNEEGKWEKKIPMPESVVQKALERWISGYGKDQIIEAIAEKL